MTYVDTLEEVIDGADIISLHMSATSDNHHIFDYEMFKKFKKEAVLLNMARGALINTEDLINALDDGLLQGAANIDICATGFGLAIMGWAVNSKGTSIAHFIGSSKMSMANVMKKPVTMVPVICTAAVCGLIGAFLNIQGTPMSAGFDFSGLVGPINFINLAEGGWNAINIIKAIIAFAAAPVFFSIVFKHVFTKVWSIVSEQDYFLDI